MNKITAKYIIIKLFKSSGKEKFLKMIREKDTGHTGNQKIRMTADSHQEQWESQKTVYQHISRD